MVSVAQLVEPRIVIPVVVGSSPIAHPKLRFARGPACGLNHGPGRGPILPLFGPLAQLAEQWTLNPLVVGSIPTRPTSFPVLASSRLYRFPVFPGVSGRPGLRRIRARRYNAPDSAQCLNNAKVAELVDALALGASGETRESSSLSFRTKPFCSAFGSIAGRPGGGSGGNRFCSCARPACRSC
jgi:hypothetical protein